MNRFNLEHAHFETRNEINSFDSLSIEEQTLNKLTLTIESESLPKEFVNEAKLAMEKLFGRELFKNRPMKEWE